MQMGTDFVPALLYSYDHASGPAWWTSLGVLPNKAFKEAALHQY